MRDHDLTRRRLLGLAAALCAPLPAWAAPASGSALRSGEAPIHIGRVALRAKDGEAVAAWYQSVLGLDRVEASPEGQIHLAAAGQTLLEIHTDAKLRLSNRGEAGLYHTAFLLPTRVDFARWIRYAIETRIPVDGVADHLVSEAVYLTDPEGNGVEICTDRAPESWRWSEGQIEMGTEALDVEDLVKLSDLVPIFWSKAPAGTIIGHVHLKVGDVETATAWWIDTLGFDLVRGRTGAAFLSTGGYHHHVAVNTWESAGAGQRDPQATGLSHIELLCTATPPVAEATDPWGTRITLRKA